MGRNIPDAGHAKSHGREVLDGMIYAVGGQPGTDDS